MTSVLQRIQSILLNAAEGQRSIGDDRQYQNLRKRALNELDRTPNLIVTHSSVDSFSVYIKTISDRTKRVRLVRSEFADFSLDRQDDLFDPTYLPPAVSSSSWTGVTNKAERVIAVRTMLPIAQSAIDSMIEGLDVPEHNKGPPLEETEEAIETLRKLHTTLGDLIKAAESGELDDDLGQDLASKAVRWAKQVSELFKDDPIPYAASVLLGAGLGACGLSELGGAAGSLALATTRPTSRLKEPTL